MNASLGPLFFRTNQYIEFFFFQFLASYLYKWIDFNDLKETTCRYQFFFTSFTFVKTGPEISMKIQAIPLSCISSLYCIVWKRGRLSKRVWQGKWREPIVMNSGAYGIKFQKKLLSLENMIGRSIMYRLKNNGNVY